MGERALNRQANHPTLADAKVSDRAEDCQVDGARTGSTLNIGGSATTTVSFVVSTA